MNQNHSENELTFMIGGYWISQAIAVVAKLGIADHLKTAPKSYQELAELTKVDANSLYRLLRALACVGVFEQKSNGQFAITPLSLPLTSDHPSTLRSFAIMHGEEWHWKSWGQLYQSVKTGRPGIELEYGEDVFSYLAKHSDASENFNQTMEDLTTTMTDTNIQAYDFSQHNVIADVGGSYGQLLSAILKSAPLAKGILFDLPDVIAKAEARFKEHANDPVSKRITCQKGSFFESFPDSAEIYILKWILHDWKDESCLKILSQFKRLANPSAKLLLIERILPDSEEFSLGKLVDLEMMAVTPGGRERTLGEFEELIGRAELKIVRVVSTESPFSIIEVR